MKENKGEIIARETLEKLSSVFTNVKCGDIVKKQQVIQIAADVDVNEACQTLLRHNISSAPVYDVASDSYLGMLDYGDLVHYILLMAEGKKPQTSASSESQGSDSDEAGDGDCWDAILADGLRGGPVRARLMTDLSKRNPFYAVLSESPILAAAEVMSRGVHRLNVMAGDGTLAGVLSQTDILRRVLSDSETLLALNQVRVRDLPGLVHRPVIWIEESANLVAAFKTMISSRISSLAVVDADRRLVGHVSISDVRYLFKHASLRQLWGSCLEFVSASLQEEGLERGKDKFPFFDVHEDSSIAHVIGKLLATKTHRVWVVDRDNKLSGVISMTDILNVFCLNDQDDTE